MRRAVLAILGTAATTSALVTLKAYAQDPTVPAAATAPADAAAASGPAGAAPAPTAPASARPTGSRPPGSGGTPATRAVKGRSVSTPYGPVTVTITVSGARITDVGAVLPRTGESAERSDRAGPQLRQQALVRQSAKLDTVSGATFTSEGYRQSLQSAIDQAKRG